MTSCRNYSNGFINYRHPHRHFCHNSRIWHPKTRDTVTRVLTRITDLSWLVLHCIIPSRHYRFKACLCFAGTKHACVWQLWPLFIIFRSYAHFIVYDRGISFAFLGPPGPDVYKSLVESNACFGASLYVEWLLICVWCSLFVYLLEPTMKWAEHELPTRCTICQAVQVSGV